MFYVLIFAGKKLMSYLIYLNLVYSLLYMFYDSFIEDFQAFKGMVHMI